MTWCLGVAMLSAIACTREDQPAAGTAHVSFNLTDSPGPYQEINIDVQGVKLHTDQSGWISVPNVTTGVYNLLDFTGGADTLIANGDVPEGMISQIRLELGTNNSIMVDSVVHPLTIPSGFTTGLKLNFHHALESGLTYVFTLDFDAAKSIVVQGNGEYKLKPVIRVITDDLDGGIEGMVMPDSVLTAVYAIQGPDSTSAFTDSTGAFFIGGLSAGLYDLYLESATGATATQSGVVVTLGVITDVGTIQL